ncbi:hypothetical protein NDU88_000689 [Pleurodeles waltl]|uniref:Uncharacterized protein n=1 Tax=Pleurodeles waltl TaxID=8319 RepID=A0AAV7WG79_PLEWA|nr:hypothetical protein NDU88_000689 [Pleurodeles waltl]
MSMPPLQSAVFNLPSTRLQFTPLGHTPAALSWLRANQPAAVLLGPFSVPSANSVSQVKGRWDRAFVCPGPAISSQARICSRPRSMGQRRQGGPQANPTTQPHHSREARSGREAHRGRQSGGLPNSTLGRTPQGPSRSTLTTGAKDPQAPDSGFKLPKVQGTLSFRWEY